LEQQRTELRTECLGDLAERRERVLDAAQALIVRDPPRRLQREAKAVRGLPRPIGEDANRRHPVARVVDLHAREALGVEGQHALVADVLRIKRALPLLVVVSRCADPVVRHGYWLVFASRTIRHAGAIIDARLALGKPWPAARCKAADERL